VRPLLRSDRHEDGDPTLEPRVAVRALVRVLLGLHGGLALRADLSVLFHDFETWSSFPDITTKSSSLALDLGVRALRNGDATYVTEAASRRTRMARSRCAPIERRRTCS